MKSALVIGDINSIWIRDFILYVLIPNGYQVTVEGGLRENIEFSSVYKEKGVVVRDANSNKSFLNSIPKVRGVYQAYLFRKLIKNHEFNKIFLIYVSPYNLRLICSSYLKNISKYALFIGSDIFRRDDNTLKKIGKILDSSNVNVVCESVKLSQAFYRKVSSSKDVQIIHFGSGQLCDIDRVFAEGVDTQKKAIGIASGKITICIGYNAIKSHQHMKVIESVMLLPDNYRDKIHLIVPVAYGGDSHYINQINTALIESKISFSLLRNFLNPTEIAKLRVATDIYINSQTTDNLSSSLLEFMYAGSCIINATWLEYPDLEEEGIYFDNTFSNFIELTSVLKTVLDSEIKRERISYKKIEKFVSWDYCRECWTKYLVFND